MHDFDRKQAVSFDFEYIPLHDSFLKLVSSTD